MAEAASLRCLPALAARRPKKGSAALDDIPHIHRLQFAHILFEQAVVAVVDSPYMNAFIERRTRNRTRLSIHSRAVPPARHDCDTL